MTTTLEQSVGAVAPEGDIELLTKEIAHRIGGEPREARHQSFNPMGTKGAQYDVEELRHNLKSWQRELRTVVQPYPRLKRETTADWFERLLKKGAFANFGTAGAGLMLIRDYVMLIERIEQEDKKADAEQQAVRKSKHEREMEHLREVASPEHAKKLLAVVKQAEEHEAFLDRLAEAFEAHIAAQRARVALGVVEDARIRLKLEGEKVPPSLVLTFAQPTERTLAFVAKLDDVFRWNWNK